MRGFIIIFFPRAQNRTCQQWAATQLCKECHGWQLHSCRGLGWALLVQQSSTQGPLCHGTYWGGSKCPDSWKTTACSPFPVSQSLVMTVNSSEALERAQRNSSYTVSFFKKATIFLGARPIIYLLCHSNYLELNKKLWEHLNIPYTCSWIICRYRWVEQGPHAFWVICVRFCKLH